jgi:hypothetical protein
MCRTAARVVRNALLPVREGVLLDRIDDLDARVRHQDDDPAELCDHRIDAVIDLGLDRHVHRDADCPTALRRDFPRDCTRRVELGIGNGNDRAFNRQRLRNGLADAAGRTRDDGHFAFESVHVCPGAQVEVLSNWTIGID